MDFGLSVSMSARFFFFFRIAEIRVAGIQLIRLCVVKTAKSLISRQRDSLIVREIYSTLMRRRQTGDEMKKENVMKIASLGARLSIGLAGNCEILVDYFQQCVPRASYEVGLCARVPCPKN